MALELPSSKPIDTQTPSSSGLQLPSTASTPAMTKTPSASIDTGSFVNNFFSKIKKVIKPTDPFAHSADEYVGLTPQEKIAKFQQEGQQATDLANKANNPFTIAKETFSASGIGKVAGKKIKSLGSIPVDIVKSVVSPESEQLDFESKYLNPENPKTTIDKILHPADVAASAGAKLIYRVMRPAFQSYADTLGQSIAANETPIIPVDGISTNPKALSLKDWQDTFPSVAKTNLQAIGDSIMAGSAIFMPEIYGKGAAGAVDQGFIKAFKQGVKTSLPAATTFGIAGALSSGSKDPIELGNIFIKNFIGISMLGAVTHSAIPLAKDSYTRITKNIIHDYKLPEYITLSPDQVKEAYGRDPKYLETVKKDVQEAYLSSGRTNEQFKNDFKNGVTLKLPFEEVVKISDKPWFKKVKNAFGIESTTETITNKLGTTTEAPRGFIEAPKTPEEAKNVVNQVVEQVKNTPEVKPQSPVFNEKPVVEHPLIAEAKKYKSVEEFVNTQPKTIKLWYQSKFSNDGAYVDYPVIRKEDNLTLYQGGKEGDQRQFWTPNKKYAEYFGNVKEKTGSFYRVDNGNRMTDVYVEAPTKSELTDIYNKAHQKELTPTEQVNISKDIRDLPLSPEQKNALQSVREGNITKEVKDVLNTIDPKVFDSLTPDFNKKVQAERNRTELPEVPVSLDKTKAILKQHGITGVEPAIVDAILTPDNGRAWGVYAGGTISLERFVQAYTENHEVFHLLFQNMESLPLFNKFDKKALLEEARNLYGEKLTDRQLEEQLAIDFQQYVNERETGKPSSFFDKIKDFFNRLYASLKRAFSKTNDIDELYRTMNEGKATTTTEIKNVMSQAFNKKVAEGVADFRIQKAVGDFLEEVPVKDAFTDSGDLTLKTITKLEGRSNVSKQYIEDLTNSADIKQPERELIRAMLLDEPAVINVPEFVEKVKAELLPLEVKTPTQYNNMEGRNEPSTRYEFVNLPQDQRGNVANYAEHIYESPIKTSAGDTHFSGQTDHYFGHTRIEDMADGFKGDGFIGGGTRRVLEVQSDLYQKGRLEGQTIALQEKLNQNLTPKEKEFLTYIANKDTTSPRAFFDAVPKDLFKTDKLRVGLSDKDLYEYAKAGFKDPQNGLAKLQQYSNPTAHFRMVREEIKKAANAGKTKLQFPTGETAMKIEGLGERNPFSYMKPNGSIGDKLKVEDLRVGQAITEKIAGDNAVWGRNSDWIITDVLGDGKFKAVQKINYDNLNVKKENGAWRIYPNKSNAYVEVNAKTKEEAINMYLNDLSETFDISGKVDTNNPIYRFYEKDLGRYLKNNYDAVPVTDNKGVTWYEMDPTGYGDIPVPAFNERPKTPQEILADAEKQALEKQAGGQSERIKKLRDLVKASDSFDTFTTKVQNNPMIQQWAKDIEDTGAGSFNEFYKTQKSIQANPDTAKLDQLQKNLQREEESIAEAKAKPEAFVKAYGPEKLKQIEAKASALRERIAKAQPEMKKERSISPDKIVLPEDLQKMKDEIEIRKDAREMIGGGFASSLLKYVLKAGDFEGQLPEVLGHDNASYLKHLKKSNISKLGKAPLEFAKYGDTLVHDAGFDNVEDAIAGIEAYKKETEEIKQLEREFRTAKRNYITDERDRYALNAFLAKEDRVDTLRKVEQVLREEGKSRKAKVDAIQEYFNLTDSEIGKILKGSDFRLLSDKEFENLLKKVQGMAFDIAKQREAVMNVKYTIEDLELKKVENLQQAMKLPKLENMTVNQLEEFDNLLSKFQRGDEFLGIRQLETVKNTDLKDIKTKREALEDLLKRVREIPKYKDITLADVKNFSIGELDRFRYDSALARRHPFFEMMVHDANLAQVSSGIRYTEFKNKLQDYIKKARASRPKTLTDKIAPIDEKIFKWLGANTENKVLISAGMTAEELDAAKFIQENYAKVRDYLINQGTLKAYRSDYITHIRRSFLEAVLKGTPGEPTHFANRLKSAFKEMFDVYKQDEAVFGILNQKTKDVLPLEKFFQYSMKRSDKLVPTMNVAQAVLRYMETFEKKVALDALIPKIDIYAHSLAPTQETARGLEMDPSIKNFVKEWLNTKKGRVTDSGLKPGGLLDWSLRSLIAITRIRDLGLNIAVGLGSNFGAQMSVFTPLGPKKYALGTARSYTKQGKEIAKKYESFVGETLLKRMHDLSKSIGDKFAQAAFGLFSAADRKARIQYLLGSLTAQEFKTGNLSNERLANLKTEMGRYLPTHGDESIMGKTSMGKAVTQYKGWAVQILSTSYDNLKQLTKMAKAKDFKGAAKSKEFAELLRGTIGTIVLGLIAYGTYSGLRDKKDRTFLEQLAYKSMNDALSMVGALDPSLWTQTPRAVQFVGDIGKSVSNILVSLATGDAEKAKTNLDTLGKTLEPNIVSTIFKGNSDKAKVDDYLNKSIKTYQTKINAYDKDLVDKVKNVFDDVVKVGFGTDEADAMVENLTDNEYTIYKTLKSQYQRQQALDMADEIKPIVEQANELGFGTDAADQLIEDNFPDTPEGNAKYDAYVLIKKAIYGADTEGSNTSEPSTGIVSDTQAKQVAGKWEKQSFVTKIANIAKAVGTDPVTAFNDIFAGNSSWRIVGMTNGQIMVSRMPMKTSESIKKKLGGANKNFKLDHVVSLEAGGNNGDNNLSLIPTDVWESNTPVENMIGQALKDGNIDGKQAREYLIRYKATQNQPISKKLLKEFNDKYKGETLTAEQIQQLVK